MRPSHKQVGCCTLCGKEVFEVKGRWPSSHPLAGEVKKIGGPLPTAYRATLVLMSGCKASVTLCGSCRPTPQRLPELWTICVSANAQELDLKRTEELGLPKRTEAQQDACVETLRQMVVDLPIAVELHRWEEDHDLTALAR